MRVRVLLHGFKEKEREVDVGGDATVADLLRALDIRRDLVVVFRGDRPVPDTDGVAEGETLRVLRVVSGGRGTFFREAAASAPRSCTGRLRT